MELAEKIYFFFIENKNEIDLPFFKSFPKNCCESASLFLGKIIKEKKPQYEVFFVKGLSGDGECHYWLEIDRFVVDITIEQFDGFESPVYSAAVHPLVNNFKNLHKIDILTAFTEYEGTNKIYKNTLLVNMNLSLNWNINV